MTHFGPSELILPETDRESLTPFLPTDLRNGLITPQADWTFQRDYSLRLLLDHFKVASLEGFGLDGEKAAVSAAGALLYYVRETQKTELKHITGLSYFEPANYLKLDPATVTNLERNGRPSRRFLVERGELADLVSPLQLVRFDEAWFGGRHEARVLARKDPAVAYSLS